MPTSRTCRVFFEKLLHMLSKFSVYEASIQFNNMEDVNTAFWKFNFWSHQELVGWGWVETHKKWTSRPPPPLEMLTIAFVLQMLSKVSTDKSSIHYFQNMSSAFGVFAPDPTGAPPQDPARGSTSVPTPRPLNLPTTGKKTHADVRVYVNTMFLTTEI